MDIARRLYVLTLLTAAAVCAYVVYRVYWRAQYPDTGEPWPGASFETSPATGQPAEPVSTEAETMVVSSMATSSVPAAAAYEENGSSLVAAPAAPIPGAARVEDLREVKKPLLSGPVLAALGALVGAAAIALGGWAVMESTDSDSGSGSTEAVQSDELISVLSQPATERIPLAGSDGRIILVAAANGRAYLVLDGLGLAPSGEAYQAWVIRPGAAAPASAAVFSGSELVVPLALAVRPGAVVAITIERAGGVRAPTQTPTIVGERAT